MIADDGLAVGRAREQRWLPRRPRTLEAAARFVDDVGFALLFPADGPVAPSLYEAVAGPDAEPFAHGMGDAESKVWTWKDALPEAGLAWSGKFLHRRASLLSPRLLAALYPGTGEPDDHLDLPLSPEAHRLAEALAAGPLPSSALRELVGKRSRYDRAIGELHRHLLVTSAGVREQRTGWPAVLIDLTCRRFEVGGAGLHDAGSLARSARLTGSGAADHQYAAGRFLDTLVEAAPAQLARAYGWPVAAARAELDALVTAGRATKIDGGYRVA